MAERARVQVFESADALGAYAAARTLERLKVGLAARGVMTLGCPGGRTPQTTYAALARLIAGTGFDGSRLHLVMMDEYAERTDAGWRIPPERAHFSCTGFGERFIRGSLNAGLTKPIPRENLHLPDVNQPEKYEDVIANLGGIDVFLLASGASDGHVAFNPIGTNLRAGTRRVELSEATRRDNLKTFPDFRDLAEVPRFGVSVGPGTIAHHSHFALLILVGADKGKALTRISSATGYDPTWPATVIHACRAGEILADRAAATTADQLSRQT
jgi:glucosamine-6-phosphate deaminase